MPTYPLSLPLSSRVAGISIRQRVAVASVASPFNFKAEVQVWGGQAWAARITVRPGSIADIEPLLASIISLNGPEGSFLLGDTARFTPRGVATGTPLVKGGGQSGYSLITDGWTNSITGILKAGDWFQLGTGATARLYKLTADASSNGSGEATLNFWPMLRSSPSDNAALTVTNAQGVFMLGSEVSWDIDAAKVYGFGFDAVEDLRS